MAASTKKPPTKSEIYAKIVEDTGLTRKDVAAVFDSLNGQIKKNLGGRGAVGTFTLPGLLKMRVVKKPQGRESLHRRGNDVQGKTGIESCQGVAAEGPEGHGLVFAALIAKTESRGITPAFFVLSLRNP